ncbi:hypothetical protein H8B09_25170 [Paenibacillus sp. PR3]|uniref:Uncharacterized protein n=1 Tax=Paenibacillus terricola TaxID=2763503 RepID=A0ABR8N1L9_9BACL|nr:hypothetical protein [Paenibacillus terricola]MBD3922078.1 hypothetical protein [Paenibacillus terricola]
MKKYILLVCAALAVTVYSSIELSDTKSKAAEAPSVKSRIVETASGRLIRITDPRDLKDLVSHSTLIVKGKIIKTENVQEEIQLIEGTPERAAVDAQGGKSTRIRSGTNYTISVSDVIKGQPDNQEITVYISEDEISLRPELKIGDELIFNLAFNKTIGRYTDVHPSAGYLKVNADNKVKPMFDGTNEISSLENESYDEVKRKIRDIK